jgi:hypothetical protein
VVAVNADVGETVGWPELAQTVAAVERRQPDSRNPVILTANYGEAGAIDRFGPDLGLPHAYSGHNAYGDWGPPPNGARPVIAVGLDRGFVERKLRGCMLAARVENDASIDNDESGAPVFTCHGPRVAWSREWPSLLHLG